MTSETRPSWGYGRRLRGSLKEDEQATGVWSLIRTIEYNICIGGSGDRMWISRRSHFDRHSDLCDPDSSTRRPYCSTPSKISRKARIRCPSAWACSSGRPCSVFDRCGTHGAAVPVSLSPDFEEQTDQSFPPKGAQRGAARPCLPMCPQRVKRAKRTSGVKLSPLSQTTLHSLWR